METAWKKTTKLEIESKILSEVLKKPYL